ncbi:MAG: hypothetical protein RLP09_06950 [Sandaracinaceae bacterium]
MSATAQRAEGQRTEESWRPGADVAPETWPENGYDWLGPEVLIAIGRSGGEPRPSEATLCARIAEEGHAPPSREALRASLSRLRDARLVAPDRLRLSPTARALLGGVRPAWWQRRFWYAHLGLR